ncbi:hypothetical protein [Micromonospora avicenniae]|uniref:hypothetical protein n=1 Tax=Micromonospora avicenniae TaxID=1198245 RepID=UPI0033303302
MEYVVTFDAEDFDGRPIDPVIADQAGGRLAVYEPRMSIDQNGGPGITVTVTVDEIHETTALSRGLTLIHGTFDALGVNLAFRSATVTRGDVWEARQTAGGSPADQPRYWVDRLPLGSGEGGGSASTANYWVVRDRENGNTRIPGPAEPTRNDAQMIADEMNG